MNNNIMEKDTAKLPINYMNRLAEDISELIEFAEIHNLTNEQDFINWLDKINELSVKH